MNIRSHHGSLLFSLVIVLSVLAVLMALSIPRQFIIRQFLLRAEIEKLYSLCYYLQQLSMSTNRCYTLTLDCTKSSYYSDEQKDFLPKGIIFGVLPETMGPPSQPMHLVQKAITFLNNQIIFFPDGTVSSGTIYLTDQNQKEMYALTSPISQISYLRVYRYKKNRWILVQ